MPSIIHLCRALSDFLLKCDSPCKEYELHQQFSQELSAFIPASIQDATHRLFYKHFVLFHCLHRIRFEWLLNQTAILELSPLHIHYRPYIPSCANIIPHDPLISFYSDLNQLTQIQVDTLHQWLNSFWQKMLDHSDIQQALDVFGFDKLPSLQALKHRYRTLALQLHPDKGGHCLQIKKLNQAYKQLKSYY